MNGVESKLVNHIIKNMIIVSNEQSEYEELNENGELNEGIAYREGLYDGYLKVLFELGLKVEEINLLELEEQQNIVERSKEESVRNAK